MLVCRKCRGEVGKGKQLVCTEAQAVRNLTGQAQELGSSFGKENSRSYQRVATNLLKHAETKEGIQRGEKFLMATGRDRVRQRERDRQRDRQTE